MRRTLRNETGTREYAALMSTCLNQKLLQTLKVVRTYTLYTVHPYTFDDADNMDLFVWMTSEMIDTDIRCLGRCSAMFPAFNQSPVRVSALEHA